MKTMRTTKKLQADTILRIYKKGFGYARLTVAYVTDDFLAALCEEEILGNIQAGDTIEAYVWLENDASYEFILQVTGSISIGKKMLIFSHADEIRRSDERKCLGLRCEISFNYYPFNRGQEEKTFSSQDVRFRQGTILYLEDREAIVDVPDQLPADGFIRAHVRLGDHEVEIVGYVEPLQNEAHQYTLTYTGMHEKERNKILDYIFRFYRE